MDLLVNLQALGEQVLLHRRRAGLSQQAIAARAGVDTMTISRLESGTKKRLEIETAARVARVLGVSLDQICGLQTTEGKVMPTATATTQPEPAPVFHRPLETPYELAAQIFSWHEDEGMTLQAIAQRLNAEGVPTRSGRGKWYLASVSELLHRIPRGKKDRQGFLAQYGHGRHMAADTASPQPTRQRTRQAAPVT